MLMRICAIQQKLKQPNTLSRPKHVLQFFVKARWIWTGLNDKVYVEPQVIAINDNAKITFENLANPFFS